MYRAGSKTTFCAMLNAIVDAASRIAEGFCAAGLTPRTTFLAIKTAAPAGQADRRASDSVKA